MHAGSPGTFPGLELTALATLTLTRLLPIRQRVWMCTSSCSTRDRVSRPQPIRSAAQFACLKQCHLSCSYCGLVAPTTADELKTSILCRSAHISKVV